MDFRIAACQNRYLAVLLLLLLYLRCQLFRHRRLRLALQYNFLQKNNYALLLATPPQSLHHLQKVSDNKQFGHLDRRMKKDQKLLFDLQPGLLVNT